MVYGFIRGLLNTHEDSAGLSAQPGHVLELQARPALRVQALHFSPLGLLTVAALLPSDWQLKLVDLNVDRLKDSDLRWADYVMISAMIVQKQSVREIVARCAALKKPVIAGGPLFTTGYEAFPAIRHFVLGEAEELMPQVVADMAAGTVRPLYSATEPAGYHAACRRLAGTSSTHGTT